jgi:UDP-glucose 4-epimerase
MEAVLTNINGASNVVRGICEHQLPVRQVVTISTDKACKPVNVMGMTKAIQERIVISANLVCPNTSFMAVRYGNVVASRGSVVPHFHDQIQKGGPVTITSPEMTRFLLRLDEAVDTVFEALRHGQPGETLIPRVASARVTDIARAMIGDRKMQTQIMGIRPGEKIHEIMISEEECLRTSERNGYYVIHSITETTIRNSRAGQVLTSEYSSNDSPLPYGGVQDLLHRAGFITQ